MAQATCLRMKQWMERGGFIGGEYLPSERELAVRFSTSRVTVRQALEMLERDGWIVRRPNSRPQISSMLRPIPAPRSHSEGNPHLGLLVNQASDSYALMTVRHILQVAGERQVRLSIENVCDYTLDSLAKAERLQRQGCSALIIPWVPRLSYGAIAEFLQRSPLPCSVPISLAGLEQFGLNHQPIEREGTTIMVQDACRYYSAMGQKRIALLGPDSPGGEIMNRHLMAYVRYVCEHQLPTICAFPGPLAKDMDCVAENWRSYAGDLAVICYDDDHAMRFLSAMHKYSLGAPRDFSIIGCNNTPQCISADPPLTSFCMDYELLAAKLLDLALSLGTGKEAQKWPLELPLLVVRESCGGKIKLGERLSTTLQTIESVSRVEQGR